MISKKILSSCITRKSKKRSKNRASQLLISTAILATSQEYDLIELFNL